MKKVLIFIDWFLPGYKAGGPIQSVANLVNFLENKFSFDIITRNTDYMDNTPYYNIKSNAWNIVSPTLRVFYISENKLTRNNITHFIQTGDYQVVYITGIYSLYFSIFPLYAAQKKKIARIVIAPRGMLSSQATEIKSFKKSAYLKVSLFTKSFKKVVFHATNKDELEDIKKRFPANSFILSPNIPRLNTKGFNPLVKNTLRLIYLGRVSPEKNLLYAIEVLQAITTGEIEFSVYGTVYDKKYWKKCKEASRSLPKNINFNYKGSLIPAKVFDKLSEYHALFLPSTGENFGHSIYETFSVGRLVLISDNTPWKNILLKKIGWDFSLMQKEQFTGAIQKLQQMSQEEYNLYCENAYNYAQNYLKEQALYEKAINIFEDE